MFLDSGNIISDETFYTQSQIMVEKVPEFLAESLCLRQGMVTRDRWCRHLPKIRELFPHLMLNKLIQCTKTATDSESYESVVQWECYFPSQIYLVQAPFSGFCATASLQLQMAQTCQSPLNTC